MRGQSLQNRFLLCMKYLLSGFQIEISFSHLLFHLAEKEERTTAVHVRMNHASDDQMISWIQRVSWTPLILRCEGEQGHQWALQQLCYGKVCQPSLSPFHFYSNLMRSFMQTVRSFRMVLPRIVTLISCSWMTTRGSFMCRNFPTSPPTLLGISW
jgi:hypothetical protein